MTEVGPTDKPTTEQRLAMAESALRSAGRVIATQRKIIARLEAHRV